MENGFFSLHWRRKIGICSCFLLICSSFTPPQRPVDLVSVSLVCLLARRHECQGSHQQGGLRAPRREDAGRRDGEAEDKEEDPLPGHRGSGRLHDLHLPLRLEIPMTFFLLVLFVLCLFPCDSCRIWATNGVTREEFGCWKVTHFNIPLPPPMLSLMSLLTFPPPTGRLIANLIYCWTWGQSFLSGFRLKCIDLSGINWGLNYSVYPRI